MAQDNELTHMPYTPRWESGERSLVLVPASPDQPEQSPYPVLCFLHGHQEARTGKHPLGPAAHRSPAYHALRGDPLTRGFLIVCPQRDEPGRWTPNDAEGVHALLNSAIAEHRGDENRIYLTGFSYGGDAVLRFPTYSGGDRFQKLWAVDPAVDNETPALPANRPLLIHYGVHFPQMTSFLDDWKSRGKPGEVRLKDTDFEHVATCRAAYADSEAYKWLEERG